jgi:hypothetical protein
VVGKKLVQILSLIAMVVPSIELSDFPIYTSLIKIITVNPLILYLPLDFLSSEAFAFSFKICKSLIDIKAFISGL